MNRNVSNINLCKVEYSLIMILPSFVFISSKLLFAKGILQKKTNISEYGTVILA